MEAIDDGGYMKWRLYVMNATCDRGYVMEAICDGGYR